MCYGFQTYNLSGLFKNKATVDLFVLWDDRMRLFSLLVLVLSLGLSSCASGPSLQSRLAAYIGAPEAELVQNLGVPDKQIEVKGVKYLAYQVRYQAQTAPVMPPPYWGPGYWGPGWAWSPPFPQNVQVWACEATFVLVDNKVQTFYLRGNDCN